jgi:hypothetical protein
MQREPRQFFSDCINWPDDLVDVPGGLCDCRSDADDMRPHDFFQNVDMDTMTDHAHALGYTGPSKAHNDPDHIDHKSDGMSKSMEEDPAVDFYRSELFGKTVYFYRHSGIEHVFLPPDWTPSIDDVQWPDDEPDQGSSFSP